jgi:hypothetical protein
MALVVKQGSNILSTRKVPIIFVPGVMGSRLHFPNVNEDWDPDSSWAMFHWVRISAEKARQEMGFRAPATVMTSNSGLSAAETQHGYAGVASGFYVDFLRHLVGLTTLCATCPVYAVGYDWRQSNKDSGNALDTQITAILAQETAENFILISHSMGGIVSRSCLQSSGNAGKLSGVIHVVQPATGAAVFYRRMYTGAIKSIDGGQALSWIQGTNARDFATVLSGLRGPCELIPNNNYRDTGAVDWLWDDRVTPATAWNGPMFPWYLSATEPPNVWWSVAGVLTKVTPTPLVDLRARMSESDTFHAGLGLWKHANTWAIYSTGLTTDMAVRFSTATAGGVVLGGAASVQMQRRAEGDGTVPGSSASALFSAAETSTDVTGHELIMDRSKKQVQVSGVDHAAAFASNDVRNIIEQMLLIALGCVSAPGDFPPPGQTVADSSNGGSQSTDSSTADSSGQVASNDSGNTDSGNPPDPSDWSTDSQATT